MSRGALAAAVAAALVALIAPGVAAADAPLAESAGVQHVRQIPINGSVGANFKTYEDGRTYMFVTGTLGSPKTDPGVLTGPNYGGVWVYDVTRADNPTLVSHLPLPHYENEDVSIGGHRLLVSGDGTQGGSNLAVVDISDPKLLKLEKVVNMQLLDEGHTATCIQDCRYAWVAGGSTIAVLRLDETAQVPLDQQTGGAAPGVQVQGASSRVEAGDLVVQKEFGWSTHDVQVDSDGYAWVVGGNGTIGFDTRPGSYGEDNLLRPTVVARTGDAALNSGGSSGLGPDGSTVNDFIHHNSLRPGSGDTVLITEEDIWDRTSLVGKGGCDTQGSFQAWRLDNGLQPGTTAGDMSFVGEWKTEYNRLVENDPTGAQEILLPSGGFCSAHYFDAQPGTHLTVNAWYDQGTRILDTSDPAHIRQVGYFMAPDSVVWAAYFSPTDPNVIYVADHQRGIDVLRIAQGGSVARRKTVRAPIASWWKQDAKGSRTGRGVASPRFGWACRLTV